MKSRLQTVVAFLGFGPDVEPGVKVPPTISFLASFLALLPPMFVGEWLIGGAIGFFVGAFVGGLLLNWQWPRIVARWGSEAPRH